jgi:hypothetical protein
MQIALRGGRGPSGSGPASVSQGRRRASQRGQSAAGSQGRSRQSHQAAALGRSVGRRDAERADGGNRGRG